MPEQVQGKKGVIWRPAEYKPPEGWVHPDHRPQGKAPKPPKKAAWSKAYPTSYPAGTGTTTLTADAQQRWQNSMSAFQDTLKVQAQVVQNVQADTATLTTLTNASQNATGNLAVSQATNQLIAPSTKQQLQIQSLMAAQYRATALDQARNAEAEQDGQTQFQTFLGANNAYNPQ